MMVLRSSAWSLPWEKVLLMMLLTPFGGDLWNTLLYHLEALQLSFSPFFLCSFPTLSEGYNTGIRGLDRTAPVWYYPFAADKLEKSVRCDTNEEPWCSGLTCLPVTQKIAGSNPVGSGRFRDRSQDPSWVLGTSWSSSS